MVAPTHAAALSTDEPVTTERLHPYTTPVGVNADHIRQSHAQLRSPGERANAQLKTWRILRKLRCCPWRPDNSPRPSTSFKPAR